MRVNASTFEIIKAAVRGDTTLAPDERNRILSTIKGGEAVAVKDSPRLVRRAEAAKRLSCSLRLIDKLASSGVLPKRTLPGRARGAGFLESDLLALVNGRAA